MPRYFFHIRDGQTFTDVEGIVLPDFYSAQTEAVHTAGEILRDMGAKFWNRDDWRLEVADEDGKTLFVLRVCAEEPPAGGDG